MLKIALLSTFGENAGDDLIRHGCKYLLRQLIPEPCHFIYWAKANSIGATVSADAIGLPSIHRMNRLARTVMGKCEQLIASNNNPWLYQRLIKSDLIVLCGTPLFYITSTSSFAKQEKWHGILLKVASMRPGLPIVTLGCGSILPENVEQTTDEITAALPLIKHVVNTQKLVACRDEATKSIIVRSGARSGLLSPVLPCPSVWAVDAFSAQKPLPSAPSRRLCVSFSLESCAWADDVASDEAMRVRLLERVLEVASRHDFKVCLLAHNNLDDLAARRLKAYFFGRRKFDIVSVDGHRLLQELGRAQGLVTWRVHGAMAARSLGVPALLFRSDSRSAMAQFAGAHVVDPRSSSVDEVANFISSLVHGQNQENDSELTQRKMAAQVTLADLWANLVTPHMGVRGKGSE